MKESTKNIIHFYENLNQNNLNEIAKVYAQDCFFQDPFHQLHSLDELKNLYIKMFQKADNPKFTITKYLENESELVLFWDFTFGKNFKISGNTLLVLNSQNLIISHVDYWDTVSEIWLKIPVIKNFIKVFYKILTH